MSLLQELVSLGEELPTGDRPSNADQALAAIAGLIYREETGSMDPPAPSTEVGPSGVPDPRDAELERLRAQLAEAEKDEASESEPAPAEAPPVPSS
jgi:hypothetical protein